MELSKYKACICEGAAETAIIDILLEHDRLIFTREEMLEEQVLKNTTKYPKFQRVNTLFWIY